jgi:hypothetical protein
MGIDLPPDDGGADQLFTHRVELPLERAWRGAPGSVDVARWLVSRRPDNRRSWWPPGRDVEVNETDDPVYAAVLAAVAEHGWEAGARAIELIEGGA